jgi:hypothetical protein
MFIFADLHIRMQVAGPQCGSERTVRADSLSVRSVRQRGRNTDPRRGTPSHMRFDRNI